MLLLGLSLAVALSSTNKATEDHLARRELLAFSRTNCYLYANGTLTAESAMLGCTDEPVNAQPCTVGASSLCKMEGNENGVDQDRWDSSYRFDFCSQATRYVLGPGPSCSSPGTSCQLYCQTLQNVGDWSSRRRGDRQESNGKSWWSCGWWSGYEWHDSRCHDSTRHLGEECWDDSGECDNRGADEYSELHMSCATDAGAGITDKPRCIPSAFTLEKRVRCECNWFDWHIGFACGASNCNGHPCVWNTGDGNRYCDYQSNNDW